MRPAACICSQILIRLYHWNLKTPADNAVENSVFCYIILDHHRLLWHFSVNDFFLLYSSIYDGTTLSVWSLQLVSVLFWDTEAQTHRKPLFLTARCTESKIGLVFCWTWQYETYNVGEFHFEYLSAYRDFILSSRYIKLFCQGICNMANRLMLISL